MQFVGYLLDYKGVELGITVERGDWLLDFIANLKDNRYTVYIYSLYETLQRVPGAFGFCFQGAHMVAPIFGPPLQLEFSLGQKHCGHFSEACPLGD